MRKVLAGNSLILLFFWLGSNLASAQVHHHVPGGSSQSGVRLLSQIARPGQDLVIPAGLKVTIDQSIDIELLTINGELLCPKDGQFVLQTTGIFVNGLFECGTEKQRFQGRLDLVLKPGRQNGNMGERSLGVHGQLRLFGQDDNAGWQRISQTAEAGSDTLILEKPVKWQVGDEVVLAPTNFNPHEAERFTIKQIDGLKLTLNTPLKYRHWGRDQTIKTPNRQWTLSERAEVANLSRRIRIFPSGTPESHNQIGGHVMVMRGGSAMIDSVEFIRMGQLGKMGRYPFHWHRLGDARGQFVVNSSIHDTYQRCLTIHGTQGTLVQNNVCFDHFAHGFFLEDGDEVNNTLIGNLGILSKKVPQDKILLLSDFGGGDPNRFPSPSTFWISNPKNRVDGNVAAGSEGTGFWMSFATAIKCDASANSCVEVPPGSKDFTHRPIQEKTISFDANVAHATLVGFTWDGLEVNLHTPQRQLVSAHYQPPNVPVFKKLLGYKNLNAGVYFRGRTAEFHDSIFADNGWSLFFAYNQVVRNSLVVARSENHRETDFNDFMSYGRTPVMSGIVLYDGPFDLKDVDFVNFSTQAETYRGTDVTSVPVTAIGGANRFTNQVQALRFTPEPALRFHFTPNLNWVDSPYSMSLRDRDGSLSGRPGTLLVQDIPYNQDPSCEPRPLNNALLCNYTPGLVIFFLDNRVAFSVTRSDGVKTSPSAEETARLMENPQTSYHNKFHMIMGGQFEYSVSFTQNYKFPEQIPLNFQSEVQGQISPVIRLEKMGGCRLKDARRYQRLDQLRSASKNSDLVVGEDLYIKLAANLPNPESSSDAGKNGQTGLLNIECSK